MHTSFPPVDAPRQRHLRLRVSDAEHADLAADAERHARSVSEVARLRMFGRATPPPTPLRPRVHPRAFNGCPTTVTLSDANGQDAA